MFKQIQWDKIDRVRFVIWEDTGDDHPLIQEIYEVDARRAVTANGKFTSQVQGFLVHSLAMCTDHCFSMSVDLLDGNNGNRLNPDGTRKEA